MLSSTNTPPLSLSCPAPSIVDRRARRRLIERNNPSCLDPPRGLSGLVVDWRA
jgi:hypothetical protein